MRMTCAYYSSLLGGDIWALTARDWKIVRAIGPLHRSDLAVPPMEHKAAIATDVTGWDLQAFRCIGDIWRLRDRQPMAPGFASPLGKVEVEETADSFKVFLVPR